MSNKELYFWSLIPEEPELSQLQELKESTAKEYNSYKSLNSPPHITVLPPKHLTLAKRETINEGLEKVCNSWKPFEIELQGYGRFGTTVLFLNVILSQQLDKFYSDCKAIYDEHALKITHPNYHPHVTLAFKDLEPEQFKRAWDKLKDETYRLRFPAKHLYCLHHNGEKWEIEDEIPLLGNQDEVAGVE